MGALAGSHMRIQQEAMKGIHPVDVAQGDLFIAPHTTPDSTGRRLLAVELEIIQEKGLAKNDRAQTGSQLAQTAGERLVVAGATLEVMQEIFQDQT